MKKVVLGISILLLFLLIGAIFMPHYYIPPPERMASTEMLACAAVLRTAVGDALIAGDPIPENSKDECDWLESDVQVLPTGEIKLHNIEFGIEISLSPDVTGTGIVWTCAGRPEQYVPSICRENT